MLRCYPQVNRQSCNEIITPSKLFLDMMAYLIHIDYDTMVYQDNNCEEGEDLK